MLIIISGPRRENSASDWISGIIKIFIIYTRSENMITSAIIGWEMRVERLERF